MNNPHMILVDSISEAKRILEELKSSWEELQNQCNNPKEIEKRIKRVEAQTKKKRISEVDLIKLSTELSTLSVLITNAKTLNYKMVATFSQTDNHLNTFLEYSSQMDDSEYWQELRNAYIIQDYAQIDYTLIRRLFMAERKNKEKLMDNTEYEFLKSLPETVTIFRGCTYAEKKENKFGLSWTLKKEIAEVFANRKSLQGRKGVVIERQIKKSSIIAYFNERNEEEIIFFS